MLLPSPLCKQRPGALAQHPLWGGVSGRARVHSRLPGPVPCRRPALHDGFVAEREGRGGTRGDVHRNGGGQAGRRGCVFCSEHGPGHRDSQAGPRGPLIPDTGQRRLNVRREHLSGTPAAGAAHQPSCTVSVKCSCFLSRSGTVC